LAKGAFGLKVQKPVKLANPLTNKSVGVTAAIRRFKINVRHTLFKGGEFPRPFVKRRPLMGMPRRDFLC
jgi:hypothetical protein